MKKSKLTRLIKKELYAKKHNDMKVHEEKIYIDDENKLFNDLMFTEKDNDIKEKSRNLIYRLLNFRDQLSFTSNDNILRIRSSDFMLKKSNKSTSSSLSKTGTVLSKVYDNEFDDFSIEIIKEVGFLINYKSNRTAFQDKEIYDDVVDKMKIVFQEVNIKNFNNLYTELMKDSGLARESNLDDLLN